MKYQLVIFDCDGTLVNTIDDVVFCFNEALSSCGFERCSFETVSSFIGKPLEEIVAGLLESGGAAFSDADVTAVASAYRALYTDYPKPNTQPFPGMAQLVDDLLASGVQVGVNSNKVEPALVGLVDRLFPGRDLLVTGYAAGRPVKPDPAGAEEIRRRSGVSLESSVYVGDTQVDLDTAMNARMDCIIMKWGQGDESLFARPELAACCETADELRAILEG